jgi:hypothetical protein
VFRELKEEQPHRCIELFTIGQPDSHGAEYGDGGRLVSRVACTTQNPARARS